mmetsp:Transcript_39944/g.35657  ORF Transcript_39944/g.35657 Transcript_39944/m.35657 type:complete len:89 (+) Transcript_39944:57-323(+)
MLNLPTAFNEQLGTISRSTRRAEPYKSFTTNSNRVSNYGGFGSISMDYGVKDSIIAKNEPVANMSMLEHENSYFYDGDNLRIGNYQSA